jgi:hypothetical protein
MIIKSLILIDDKFNRILITFSAAFAFCLTNSHVNIISGEKNVQQVPGGKTADKDNHGAALIDVFSLHQQVDRRLTTFDLDMRHAFYPE